MDKTDKKHRLLLTGLFDKWTSQGLHALHPAATAVQSNKMCWVSRGRGWRWCKQLSGHITLR